MSNPKRKLNKSIIIIPILTILVIIGFLLLFTNSAFWFKKSVHEEAKRYSTRHCLVFYPNSKTGKQYAKDLAKDVKDDRIYDYSVVPYGDYYLINYGNGNSYFTDKEYNEIVINEIDDDGKKIIADYLRYYVKKEKPDLYYTIDFINNSYIENLDFTNVTYDLCEENLKCYFPNFDINVYVPLKYVQKALNMNFNYTEESYVKPTYLDLSGDHKIICLTFDDGPKFWVDEEDSSTVAIVNTLYKYDACGTFFLIGSMLDEDSSWSDYEKYEFFNMSISQGNEYGSHTRDHDYLPDLNADEIRESISYSGEYLYNLVGYQMSLYRPVDGSFDDAVLAAQPYTAILWSDDSQDWDSDDTDTICNRMMDREYYDGDILLFHDIYDSTAEAMEKIIPHLIERGYQLVTVSDMLRAFGIDENEISYYYNYMPNSYYE